MCTTNTRPVHAQVGSAETPALLGQYEMTVSNLKQPVGIDVNDAGEIAIADVRAGEVRILRPDGTWMTSVTEVVGKPLVAPHGVAWIGDADLLIAETGRHRVIRVAPAVDANFDEQFDDALFDMDFYMPMGVAANETHIAIADMGNDRIVVIGRFGTQISIGSRGSEDGQFKRPQDVVFDTDGSILVADTGNHRVQRFSIDGEHLATFGEWGAFPGLFAEPTAIDVDDSRIYVADALNHRVQIFEKDGEFIDLWGMHALVPREGEGKIHYPDGLAVMPDGSRAIVTESFENRIQTFTAYGPEGKVFVPPPLQKGQQSHFGKLIAQSGERLAFWEPETRSILIFSTRYEVPIHVTQFGREGTKVGQFGRITAMMLEDGGATFHVVDPDNDRIQTFDLSGVGEKNLRYDPLMARFAVSRPLSSLSPDGKPLDITSMQGFSTGHRALLDARGGRIIVVDANWEFAGAQNVFMSNEGFHSRPADFIARDAWPMVDLTVDPWMDRWSKWMGNSGRPRLIREADGARHFGAQKTSDRFNYAVVYPDDGLIILNSGSLDDQVAYGTQAKFGSLGGDVGQLFQPGDVAFTQDGNIVVVDFGNHRAQIFAPDGKWLVSFGVGRAYTHRNPPPPPADPADSTDTSTDPDNKDGNSDDD
ncbi:MAG: NHL repeat-containing protein [Planctomycetota bacterium]